MTLRDQLNDLLPRVLPSSPDKAIWGTELAKVVRRRFKQDGITADDSVLRAYFSDMSRDPTSVIAKVDRGHGYYLRPVETARTESPNVIVPMLTAASQRSLQKEEKFRSLFIRWAQQDRQLPWHIDHTKAVRQQAGINKWKYPDVVSVKWSAMTEDNGIDQNMLELRRSLGDQPFRIFSAELKVDITPSTIRETFFQCVSNSRWAHSAQLAIACKIADSRVVEELERLGASYDIGVVSFGLDSDYLDELPPANKLSMLELGEIEEILKSKVSYETIASGPERNRLDWEHIQDLQTQHPDIHDFFACIARSLRDKQPYDRETWGKIKPKKSHQA